MSFTSDLINFADLRIQYLNNLILEKQNALKNVPPGRLHISHSRVSPKGKSAKTTKHSENDNLISDSPFDKTDGNSEEKSRVKTTRCNVKYYHVTDSASKNGIYLPASKYPLAKALAQKDYDTKILRSAEQEYSLLNRIMRAYRKSFIPVEAIIENYSPYRRDLIDPICQTDSEFVASWMSFTYKPKPFLENNPELFTDRNERVRSKTEVIIANILNKFDLPYRYECPLTLELFPDVPKTIYPDFTILDIRRRKTVYLEHFGMMDDEEYMQNALNRISLYEKNGIFPGDCLILTHETRKNPINIPLLKATIHHYFFDSTET